MSVNNQQCSHLANQARPYIDPRLTRILARQTEGQPPPFVPYDQALKTLRGLLSTVVWKVHFSNSAGMFLD